MAQPFGQTPFATPEDGSLRSYNQVDFLPIELTDHLHRASEWRSSSRKMPSSYKTNLVASPFDAAEQFLINVIKSKRSWTALAKEWHQLAFPALYQTSNDDRKIARSAFNDYAHFIRLTAELPLGSSGICAWILQRSKDYSEVNPKPISTANVAFSHPFPSIDSRAKTRSNLAKDGDQKKKEKKKKKKAVEQMSRYPGNAEVLLNPPSCRRCKKLRKKCDLGLNGCSTCMFLGRNCERAREWSKPTLVGKESAVDESSKVTEAARFEPSFLPQKGPAETHPSADSSSSMTPSSPQHRAVKRRRIENRGKQSLVKAEKIDFKNLAGAFRAVSSFAQVPSGLKPTPSSRPARWSRSMWEMCEADPLFPPPYSSVRLSRGQHVISMLVDGTFIKPQTWNGRKVTLGITLKSSDIAQFRTALLLHSTVNLYWKTGKANDRFPCTLPLELVVANLGRFSLDRLNFLSSDENRYTCEMDFADVEYAKPWFEPLPNLVETRDQPPTTSYRDSMTSALVGEADVGDLGSSNPVQGTDIFRGIFCPICKCALPRVLWWGWLCLECGQKCKARPIRTEEFIGSPRMNIVCDGPRMDNGKAVYDASFVQSRRIHVWSDSVKVSTLEFKVSHGDVGVMKHFLVGKSQNDKSMKLLERCLDTNVPYRRSNLKGGGPEPCRAFTLGVQGGDRRMSPVTRDLLSFEMLNEEEAPSCLIDTANYVGYLVSRSAFEGQEAYDSFLFLITDEYTFKVRW
ncbi:hypothetical protein IE53DRAFT_177897 [Violaceomyces palustris]|uniref:Uncharacterized protein n=1 Tax=Violaceomyces palustris TaxID=1673888 RepID=A0ACD0NSI2_9BASI|nr:hypothetical protein IE53DRAFT_177897 [Violaceomyces palustris]